jgi:hypothetical protein
VKLHDDEGLFLGVQDLLHGKLGVSHRRFLAPVKDLWRAYTLNGVMEYRIAGTLADKNVSSVAISFYVHAAWGDQIALVFCTSDG